MVLRKIATWVHGHNWGKRLLQNKKQLAFQTSPLQGHHDERDGVSYHQHLDCLLGRLLRRKSKKTSKLCVNGLCEGNPPVTVDSHQKGPVMRKMSYLMTSSCTFDICDVFVHIECDQIKKSPLLLLFAVGDFLLLGKHQIQLESVLLYFSRVFFFLIYKYIEWWICMLDYLFFLWLEITFSPVRVLFTQTCENLWKLILDSIPMVSVPQYNKASTYGQVRTSYHSLDKAFVNHQRKWT